jgi:hypothetical protein
METYKQYAYLAIKEKKKKILYLMRDWGITINFQERARKLIIDEKTYCKLPLCSL